MNNEIEQAVDFVFDELQAAGVNVIPNIRVQAKRNALNKVFAEKTTQKAVEKPIVKETSSFKFPEKK